MFEDVPPNNLIRIKMTVIRAAAHLNSPGASVALRVPLFSLVARPSQGAQPTTVRLQGSASALVAEVDTHAESGEGPAEPQASAVRCFVLVGPWLPLVRSLARRTRISIRPTPKSRPSQTWKQRYASVRRYRGE